MDQTNGPDCPAALADRVWMLLLQVSFDRAHHTLSATAAELQLAPAQAIALQALEAARPISMRELAERMRCHQSNITGLIDRLEARGLVERRPDPRDRRITGLALTPAGEQLRIRLAQLLYAAPACVAHLPDAEQARLHDLLLKIVNHH